MTIAFQVKVHKEGKGIFQVSSNDQQLVGGSYLKRPPI